MIFLKKVLPKSISSRFFLILVTPVIVAQLLFGYIFFGRHTETVVRYIAEMISGDIKIIFQVLNQDEQIVDISKLENDIGLNVEILENSRLKQTGIRKKTRVYRILSEELLNKDINKFYIRMYSDVVHIFVESESTPNVYKITFLRKRLYSRTTPIVMIWGAASALLMTLVAFIFLKNQIRPIRRLARAASLYGKGVDIDLQISGATEIQLATEAFIKMKTRLNKLINERMTILAGISHDLRTPLTRMKLQLSMMKPTNETKELMEDVTLMVNITNSFLEYSKEQNQEKSSIIKLLDLMSDLKLKYEDHNFNVHLTGPPHLFINAKKSSLKRAFHNIASNAKQHAQNLYISFKQENDKIKINFEDDGAGIPSQLNADIFKPFVSGNTARTQSNNANVGLGLSITKDIINAHGGQIVYKQSATFRGSNFEILIPDTVN